MGPPAGNQRLIDRLLLARVQDALTDTPVVVLQGARQVGKSTMAGQIVAGRADAALVTLDDDVARGRAADDPADLLRSKGLLAIDEVQRVPSLLLAVKAAVDKDRRPGRFLLTGSASLMDVPGIGDTLAGRIESLTLYPFSQGELTGVRSQFVDALLQGRLPLGIRSDLNKMDYLQRACAGGYPEVLTRSGRRRSAWFDNYVERIVPRV